MCGWWSKMVAECAHGDFYVASLEAGEVGVLFCSILPYRYFSVEINIATLHGFWRKVWRFTSLNTFGVIIVIVALRIHQRVCLLEWGTKERLAVVTRWSQSVVDGGSSATWRMITAVGRPAFASLLLLSRSSATKLSFAPTARIADAAFRAAFSSTEVFVFFVLFKRRAMQLEPSRS